ncbi:MAG: 16S rRNA (guanine(527)-N(7))-methyltransferase RsmG [Phototrophicaceae bacterium]
MDLFGISLNAEQVQQFETYFSLLSEWNERINLTSIVDREEVLIRHFIDSLSVLKLYSPNEHDRLLDVGTGAGLPGFPLSIIHPHLSITLMDATGKKVQFLEAVKDALALEQVVVVQSRAEEAGQDIFFREEYDVVVARALARLPVLLEYLLPFAKVGGICIAMKGENPHAELADSALALQTLGGSFEEMLRFDLPNSETPHHLLRFRKVSPTPSKYPRRAGVPTRKPL